MTDPVNDQSQTPPINYDDQAVADFKSWASPQSDGRTMLESLMAAVGVNQPDDLAAAIEKTTIFASPPCAGHSMPPLRKKP